MAAWKSQEAYGAPHLRRFHDPEVCPLHARAHGWCIRLRRSSGAPPRSRIKGHEVAELVISRADRMSAHEVALDGIGHVPRWPHGSSPSSTANGGLDVVLSDAGVDHAGQVVDVGGQKDRIQDRICLPLCARL
jgi:hypothetical protein